MKLPTIISLLLLVLLSLFVLNPAEAEVTGVKSYVKADTCCLGCQYNSGSCCCGRHPIKLRTVTKKLTHTKSVTRITTASASARGRRAFLAEPPAETQGGPRAEFAEDNATFDEAEGVPALFARHTCPSCPAGVTVLNKAKNNGHGNGNVVYCCPQPKTKTISKVVKTITKTVVKTITVKKPLLINGRLYKDVNGNKVYDIGIDLPYANTPVSLLLLATKKTARAIVPTVANNVTDSQGLFSFTVPSASVPATANLGIVETANPNVILKSFQTNANGTVLYVDAPVEKGEATTGIETASTTAIVPTTGPATMAKTSTTVGQVAGTTSKAAQVTTTATAPAAGSTTAVRTSTGKSTTAQVTTLAAGTTTVPITTTSLRSTSASMSATTTKPYPSVVLLTSDGNANVVYMCTGPADDLTCSTPSVDSITFSGSIDGIAIKDNFGFINSKDNYFRVCNMNGTSFTRCKRWGPTSDCISVAEQMVVKGTKWFATDNDYAELRMGEWDHLLGEGVGFRRCGEYSSPESDSFSKIYGVAVSDNSSVAYIGEHDYGGLIWACAVNGYVELTSCARTSPSGPMLNQTLTLGFSDFPGDNNGYLTDETKQVWVCDKDFQSCTSFNNSGQFSTAIWGVTFYDEFAFMSSGADIWVCDVTGSSPALANCKVAVNIPGTSLRALAASGINSTILTPASDPVITTMQSGLIASDSDGNNWWCMWDGTKLANCNANKYTNKIQNDLLFTSNNNTAFTLMGDSIFVCGVDAALHNLTGCNSVTPTNVWGSTHTFTLDEANSKLIVVDPSNTGLKVCNLTNSNTQLVCAPVWTNGGQFGSVAGVQIEGSTLYLSESGFNAPIWVCSYAAGVISSCTRPTVTVPGVANLFIIQVGSVRVRNNMIYLPVVRAAGPGNGILQCPLSGGLGTNACTWFSMPFLTGYIKAINMDGNTAFVSDSFGIWVCGMSGDYLSGSCVPFGRTPGGFLPNGGVNSIWIAPA